MMDEKTPDPAVESMPVIENAEDHPVPKVEANGGVGSDPASACLSSKLPRLEQVRAFAQDFTKSPLEAVASLVQNTLERAVSAGEAIAILLPYLVKSSYAQQNLVIQALDQIASPEEILNAALALYDQTQDPRLLATADQLLGNRGAASWPALKSLCGSGSAQCRYFVSTIAELEGISEVERRDALTKLARNPDLDTRREVLPFLDGGVLSDPLPVWQVFAGDPDEDIATLAADRIALPGR